jgi:hypothetical protein
MTSDYWKGSTRARPKVSTEALAASVISSVIALEKPENASE